MELMTTEQPLEADAEGSDVIELEPHNFMGDTPIWAEMCSSRDLNSTLPTSDIVGTIEFDAIRHTIQSEQLEIDL